MGLTDRSRLNCLKRRQKREQRKNENQTSNSNSVAALEPLLNISAKEKAWKKYLHAKAIYEETKDFEHWRYAQACLTDYENAARQS